MSTREIAAAIAAAAGWLTATLIAIILRDHDKIFALLVAGSTLITLGLITHILIHTLTKTLAANSQRASSSNSFVMPIDLAHQLGFKQGWEARSLAHPDELVDFVGVFEKRFPTPPN